MTKKRVDLKKLLSLVLPNNIDLSKERKDMRDLGLTEEEVEGYIEFYWDTWFPPVNKGVRD